MGKIRKTRILSPNWSIAFIALVMVLVSANLNWGKHWQGIVEADAKGYYAYLPAVFIYHDLNFGFFHFIEKEKYYNENYYYDYRANGGNDVIINKYYCGTAVAELPFFAIAHSFTSLTSGDADGYSKPYAISVNIAAIVYLIIGLIFLKYVLRDFAIPDWCISLCFLAFALGSNLFCYTVVEPGMSHVFSFAFISAFLYFCISFFRYFNSKYLLPIAFCLGMIILIRPINGMIVFALPFVAGSFSHIGLGLKVALKKPLLLISSSVLFLLIISIQLIIYKLSTGNLIVYSYQDEGFNFSDPHFIDILFSYRKGLFLYTPIYLVSLFGLIALWKRSPFKSFSVSIFLLLITTIFSSWWMWYYGGSFSARVYVEYIPIFMILLGIGLASLKRKWPKRIAVLTVFLLLAFCQIQTYQYRYFDIHWSEMDKEKYWEVFLMRNRW